jgi:hypothetical protein
MNLNSLAGGFPLAAAYPPPVSEPDPLATESAIAGLPPQASAADSFAAVLVAAGTSSVDEDAVPSLLGGAAPVGDAPPAGALDRTELELILAQLLPLQFQPLPTPAPEPAVPDGGDGSVTVAQARPGQNSRAPAGSISWRDNVTGGIVTAEIWPAEQSAEIDQATECDPATRSLLPLDARFLRRGWKPQEPEKGLVVAGTAALPASSVEAIKAPTSSPQETPVPWPLAQPPPPADSVGPNTEVAAAFGVDQPRHENRAAAAAAPDVRPAFVVGRDRGRGPARNRSPSAPPVRAGERLDAARADFAAAVDLPAEDESDRFSLAAKTLENSLKQEVKGLPESLGTRGANSDDAMKNVLLNDLSDPSHTGREWQPDRAAMLPSGGTPREGDVGSTPGRAVAAAAALVEAYAAADFPAAARVVLRFKLGTEDLAVRIRVVEGQTKAEFQTGSADVRDAILREWHATLPVDSPLRREAPSFTTDFSGQDRGGQSGHQAARFSRWPDSERPRLPLVDAATDEPAPTTAALRLTPLSRALSAFA